MSRIPFSEFTESELRIFISALEHYTKDMHKSAYIYDICDSLLGEMKFNLESRIKEWNEVLGEVIREPFSRPTPLAPDGGESPLEDSPFETGIRRGAVVIPPAAGKA